MSTSLRAVTERRSGTISSLFRTVAIAEAVTWGALLVAMFFKWIVQDDPEAGIEGGVPVAGALHGGVFVLYVLAALLAAFTFRWSPKVLVVALVAAIPPFVTVAFESRAAARGLLSPGQRPSGSARLENQT